MNLEELVIRNTSDPIDLALLAKLTKLRALRIRATSIAGGPLDLSPIAKLVELRTSSRTSTATDIAALANLTKLEWLDLSSTYVEDHARRTFAAVTSLEWLQLAETAFWDLMLVAPLTKLQRLGVRKTKVKDLSPLPALAHPRELYACGLKKLKIPAALTKRASPLSVDTTTCNDLMLWR